MDMERVQAEVEAKFAAEQQNEDVMIRKIQAQVIKHQNACLYFGSGKRHGVPLPVPLESTPCVHPLGRNPVDSN